MFSLSVPLQRIRSYKCAFTIWTELTDAGDLANKSVEIMHGVLDKIRRIYYRTASSSNLAHCDPPPPWAWYTHTWSFFREKIDPLFIVENCILNGCLVPRKKQIYFLYNNWKSNPKMAIVNAEFQIVRNT